MKKKYIKPVIIIAKQMLPVCLLTESRFGTDEGESRKMNHFNWDDEDEETENSMWK